MDETPLALALDFVATLQVIRSTVSLQIDDKCLVYMKDRFVGSQTLSTGLERLEYFPGFRHRRLGQKGVGSTCVETRLHIQNMHRGSIALQQRV